MSIEHNDGILDLVYSCAFGGEINCILVFCLPRFQSITNALKLLNVLFNKVHRDIYYNFLDIFGYFNAIYFYTHFYFNDKMQLIS